MSGGQCIIALSFFFFFFYCILRISSSPLLKPIEMFYFTVTLVVVSLRLLRQCIYLYIIKIVKIRQNSKFLSSIHCFLQSCTYLLQAAPIGRHIIGHLFEPTKSALCKVFWNVESTYLLHDNTGRPPCVELFYLAPQPDILDEKIARMIFRSFFFLSQPSWRQASKIHS